MARRGPAEECRRRSRLWLPLTASAGAGRHAAARKCVASALPVRSIAAMTADQQSPIPPQGVLPGQLGVILLGRVIMGDIAATLADLASREAIIVKETPAGSWLVSVNHDFDGHGLAGYEKALLHDLPGSLEPIGGIKDSVPERVRSALINDGIARGWLRHFQHDQRTPRAEGLAGQLRAFHRELRQLRQEHGQDALSGGLLPYAIHFGLVSADAVPLTRLAHAWVSAFAHLPGWRPAAPARTYNDEPISISSDHDLQNAANLAWAAGLI